MSEGGADENRRGPAPTPPARSIARRDFEEVIRRAAELSLSEAAPDDQLSEAEVLRIGRELGLPVQHVRQALAERPEMTVQPRWYDRYFDSPLLTLSRSVPGDAAVTLRRLEDYLVTREYLQIARRRPHSIGLVPADDAISSVARAFTRSADRHFVARARRVGVAAEPLADDSAHVRIELDLSEARSSAVATGTILGVLGGTVTGGILAGGTVLLLPDAAGLAPAAVAFVGGMAASGAAIFRAAAGSFRNRIANARMEISGLLDRLEHGDRLEPPPPPWKRRLFGNPR